MYTDGACSGNPGPGGWGTVILVDGTETPLSAGDKNTTNNRMELLAVIEGLKHISMRADLSARPITIVTDSQYVKNGITEWIINWKKNGWKTAAKKPVKNQDLWIALDELVLKFTIEWQWVKGHSGDKYNEMCDQLAVKASQSV